MKTVGNLLTYTKQIICIVFFTISAVALASDKTYIVGSDASYPPYEFVDENGQVVGFDIDVLSAVGKAAGIKLKFLNTPWKSWVNTLNDGSRDIWASGIAVQEARKELITYTDSYATNQMVVFVRADNPNVRNVHTLAGMQGKTIAGQKGSINLGHAQAVLGGENGCNSTDEKQHIIATDTQFLAYIQLLLGKVDGAIGNKTVGQYLMKPFLDKNHIAIRSFNAYDSEKSVQLAFVVKKGNVALAAKLNQGLKTIRKNGEYDKIMNKWFGNSK